MRRSLPLSVLVLSLGSAAAADAPKPVVRVGLIGQSILHFPNKGKAKDNLFDYLGRWGGGRYELKFATASGAGMHSRIDGAAELAATTCDYFVMCEGTKFPLEENGVARTMEHMGRYVAAARRAGSTPIMFMPYAHRSWYGDPRFPPERGDAKLRGGPDRLIPEALRTYKQIAKDLRIDYIPVLEAHALAHERLGGRNLAAYYADGVHMKPAGHFLNACVTHAVLTKLAPDEIAYPGDVADLPLAAESVAIARETIRRYRADRERAAYFPPPDAAGGWRTLTTATDVRRVAGLDVAKLDEALAVARASTKNGGLLVVRRGYLVYEKYFGLGHRDATPNLASVGKSVTSVAVGILMAERPDLFPDGLDQKVFTPRHMPPEVFPLSDPAKADIKLGQLLAFTAGIRGNNPCRVNGRAVVIDPPGPDGTAAMIDAVAAGRRGIVYQGRPTSAATLWCKPGEGYSYASASAHLASMMVRHVTGMELEAYVRDRLATPLGWGRFTYGYKHAKEVPHTPGGGGIAVRATDMLRFGYLLLHEGRWGDRQIVPAAHVRHCGTASPYNPHSPYSLQFDVNADGHLTGVPRDAFWKSGSGAHMLYVVPSLDLVVWKLAGRDGQYQEKDTGVPPDPTAVRAAEARKDWKPTLDERAGQRDVIRKVVEAIVDAEQPGAPK
jgi:CubicO group peptidase (beta-lactamase class C family)